MERLSRLTQLTPLVTSYESLPEGEKAEVAASLRNVAKDLPVDRYEETFELETDTPSLQNVTKGLLADQPEGENVEVTASLKNVTKNLPVDQHPINEETLELETDELDTPPDYSRGSANTSSTTDGQPLSATTGDSVGPALDGVTSDLRSLPISTEPADPRPLPTRTTVDPAEEPAVHNSIRVSYMLAALYSSFLASIRPMGALLSPRTVLPRLEEQDDETEVTQELSQAQRRLVVEEGGIWRQLSEVTSKEGTEGDVSFLARELEDKSARILTSYERRNNPPTNEVYNQSRIILEAMGVPCVNAKGGVEGEALAAAIVRDGLADYVASEDTVSLLPSFDTLVG